MTNSSPSPSIMLEIVAVKQQHHAKHAERVPHSRVWYCNLWFNDPVQYARALCAAKFVQGPCSRAHQSRWSQTDSQYFRASRLEA